MSRADLIAAKDKLDRIYYLERELSESTHKLERVNALPHTAEWSVSIGIGGTSYTVRLDRATVQQSLVTRITQIKRALVQLEN